MSEGGFLSGLFRAGAAYLEHTQFVESALGERADKRGQRLAEYARPLSDASFVGFKFVLLGLINGETDEDRKKAMQWLLEATDSARSGEAVERSSGGPPDTSAGDAERYEAVITAWHELLDEEQRLDGVVRHLMTLDERGYDDFSRRLQQHRKGKIQIVNQHAENENTSWGRSIEDQANYLLATHRTGARDARWQRDHDAMSGELQYLEWVIQASEGAWPAIVKGRTANRGNRATD